MWQNSPKYVFLPDKSVELAEFVGVLMGDGGISDYQICITLHALDDDEYRQFVVQKIESLFKITPSVYRPSTARVCRIVISRVVLVRFLNSLGLPRGNKVKQDFTIPEWILENPSYILGCVRGLIDTDGCVVIHKYYSKGKLYVYKKIQFTTASAPLRSAVQDVLRVHGFSSRIARENV